MLYTQGRVRQFRGATLKKYVGQASALAYVAITLALTGAIPVRASAQQAATTAPLVFDGATVVDVEQGKLLPSQRVVIVGNRIQTVGKASAVKVPNDAQIVDARGKYLIPGLWDMHTHSDNHTDITYPLFIAHGVTGIRDAASHVTLDTLTELRRQILAGTRVGPPRQVLAGPQLNLGEAETCVAAARQTCIRDSADAVRLVDSLKAAGVNMLKMYHLRSKMYYIIAAKARRVGLLFGGHLYEPIAMDVSDSGASILDHRQAIDNACDAVERCQLMAERFKRNGTWWVPTFTAFSMNWGQMSFVRKKTPATSDVIARLNAYVAEFWAGTAPSGNWLESGTAATRKSGVLRFAEEVGFPILVGTDVTGNNQKYEPAGISLQGELAVSVIEGLSPLTALRSATLNPAKALRATDSLGTVASGKLADLVLLDADPLVDIANITTVRAVVANGRYFDREALDKIVADVRDKAKAGDVFTDKGIEVIP